MTRKFSSLSAFLLPCSKTERDNLSRSDYTTVQCTLYTLLQKLEGIEKKSISRQNNFGGKNVLVPRRARGANNTKSIVTRREALDAVDETERSTRTGWETTRRTLEAARARYVVMAGARPTWLQRPLGTCPRASTCTRTSNPFGPDGHAAAPRPERRARLHQ